LVKAKELLILFTESPLKPMFTPGKHQHPGIDPILLLILTAAAFLLFFKLDHRPLWQDEAETACLARNVLRTGLPSVFDGKNLISQEEGGEFGQDHIWRWSPWVQIYTAALAFRLGGFETAVARFPFALMGLISILMTYALIRSRFGDIAWARLSAAFLTFSVPFLMFSRQCRYYGICFFLVLLALTAFQSKWQSGKGPAVLLIVSLVLLFHTNYLVFLSFAPALSVAALLFYPDKVPLKRSLALFVICLLLLIPGLWLYRIGDQAGMIKLVRVPGYLISYHGDLFQYLVPFPVALMILWRLIRRLPGLPSSSVEQKERFVLFLSLIILVNIICLAFVPHRFFRYLAHLIPLCSIILAWGIIRVWPVHKPAAVFLALLIGLTNWMHVLPMEWMHLQPKPVYNDSNTLSSCNVPLRLYLKELFGGYTDINQRLIDFFRDKGKPGHVILTTYGDLPLQFYTPCVVLGGLQGRVPKPGEQPDWVVRRLDTHLRRGDILPKSNQFIRDLLLLDRDYEKLVLPYPDERYGNRAAPKTHRFVSPDGTLEKITIYRKKSG
jgi:hypothetical protein